MRSAYGLYPVFLPIPLFNSLTKSLPYLCYCKSGPVPSRKKAGCKKEAEFIRVAISLRTTWLPRVQRRSHCLLCKECVIEKSKKDNVPILYDLMEYQQYQSSCIADHDTLTQQIKEAQQKSNDELREKYRKAEAEQFEKFGKVLRMSGTKGRMFELKGGGYVCEMHDGAMIKSCCWFNGQHIIQHLHRGSVGVPQHTKDCPQQQS